MFINKAAEIEETSYLHTARVFTATIIVTFEDPRIHPTSLFFDYEGEAIDAGIAMLLHLLHYLGILALLTLIEDQF